VPERVTFGEGVLWVSDPLSNTIARVDPRTGKQEAEVRVGPAGPIPGAYYVTTGGGYVWAVSVQDLYRIDPRTNRTTGRLHIGSGGKLCGAAMRMPCAGGVAFADGSVWVTDVERKQLLRIDPGAPPG
jgi:streptogramin lyase